MKKILLAVLVLTASLFGQTTPNLNLNIPAYNTQNWQVLINSNFSTLDADLSGVNILPAFKAAGLTLSGAGLTSNTGTFSGNVTIGGTFGVTGLSTLASLSVTNNATIGGTLNVTGLSTLNSLSVTNNTAIGGALSVTGISTLGVVQGEVVTGASNGNNVTLLNYQKGSSAVVGNSADQVLYTYTLPANTLGSGKGLKIHFSFLHSAGAASVTYRVFVGATGVAVASTNNTVNTTSVTLFFNDPGSTTSNTIVGSVISNTYSNCNATTSAINTGSPQTITATFNVANTDQVTPLMFMVELIQ